MKHVVDISIAPRDKGVPAASREQGRGTLGQRRESEYLPRRLPGFINVNFWDLGQKWDGSAYRDLSTQKIPAISTTFPAQPYWPDFAGWQQSWWADFRAEIEAVPLNSWESTFRKLTYDDAERYGLDVYLGESGGSFDPSKYHPVARTGSRKWIYDQSTAVAGDRWTEDGLRVPKGSSQLQLWSNSAFVSARSLASTFKVTAGDAYSDPAVDFKFSKDCDVFLYPMPMMEMGFDPINAIVNEWLALNVFYRTVPREFFLFRDLAYPDGVQESIFERRLLSTATDKPIYNKSYAPPEPVMDASIGADLLALLKSRPSARVYRVVGSSFGGLVALSEFPKPQSPTPTFHYRATWGGDEIAFTIFRRSFISPGDPMAVIRRDGEWFWMWYTGAAVASSQHSLEFWLD